MTAATSDQTGDARFWNGLRVDLKNTALAAVEGVTLTAATGISPVAGPAWLAAHWINTLESRAGNAPRPAKVAARAARWPGDRILAAMRRTAARSRENITTLWTVTVSATAVTAAAAVGLHQVYHGAAAELQAAAFATLLYLAVAGGATASAAFLTAAISTTDRLEARMDKKRR